MTVDSRDRKMEPLLITFESTYKEKQITVAGVVCPLSEVQINDLIQALAVLRDVPSSRVQVYVEVEKGEI